MALSWRQPTRLPATTSQYSPGSRGGDASPGPSRLHATLRSRPPSRRGLDLLVRPLPLLRCDAVGCRVLSRWQPPIATARAHYSRALLTKRDLDMRDSYAHNLLRYRGVFMLWRISKIANFR